MGKPGIVVAVLLGAALAGACESQDERPAPAEAPAAGAAVQPAGVVDCPDFTVREMEITLDAAPKAFVLGDATLIVPAGAVSAPVEVQVRRGTSRPGAASVALVGADSVAFAAPATLQLYHRNCPPLPEGRSWGPIYRVDAAAEQPVGGTPVPQQSAVETELTTLGEYALGAS